MNSFYETKFSLNDIIWHKLSCKKGMIIGINIRSFGVLYEIVWSDMVNTFHYEIELTEDNLSPQQT